MIALCPEHARIADNDLYSKAQLSALKRAPFVKDRLLYQWPWATEQMLVVLGRVAIVGPRPVIAIGGRDIVTFSRASLPGTAEQIVQVGVDLPDPTGTQIVSMSRNWLDVDVSKIESMEVPPGSRELNLKHKSGVELHLHLKRYDAVAFEGLAKKLAGDDTRFVAELLQLARASVTDSEGKVPVLKVRGRFFSDDIELAVTSGDVEFMVKKFGTERARLGLRLVTAEGKLVINFGNREVLRFG